MVALGTCSHIHSQCFRWYVFPALKIPQNTTICFPVARTKSTPVIIPRLIHKYQSLPQRDFQDPHFPAILKQLYISERCLVSYNLNSLFLCHAEKRKANILDNLNNTNGTIIGVTCCIVIILLIVSVIVQIKQPRKKYIIRREDFDPTMFQEVFEPPHYELCTLRSATASAELVDLADDLETYHKLRRSSSRCIHDHHCGSQLSSVKGSRSNLSTREATILTEIQPQPVRPLIPPGNRRSILVMKHSYSQDAADGCDPDDDMEEVPTTSHRLSRHDKGVQRSVSIDF